MPGGGPRRRFESQCPQHPGSSVKSNGTRPGPEGEPARRRWVCTPPRGERHGFTTIDGPVPMPVFSPAPRCPEHEGSKVVRDGVYATSTVKKRQIYRCTPADGEPSHRFVPDLARDHVHTGTDLCAACEELRGTHRGDRTIARRHSWSARLVAEALKELSGGASYAAVSREMRRRTGRKRTRRVRDADGNLVKPGEVKKPRRVKYAGSELSANAWHTAADWVEAFSPVIWDDLEPRLQAADTAQRAANDEILAEAARAAGRTGLLTAGSLVGIGPNSTEYRSPLTRPMVLMLDDIPIHVAGRRDYFVLVAAQVEWAARAHRDGAGVETLGRAVKLRLVRGYGTNSSEAWRLLLAELGYRPDFVLADRGKGLVKAVTDAFGPTVPVLPSLWHMRAAVEKNLLKTKGSRADPGTRNAKYGEARVLRPELVAHLDGLRRRDLHAMSANEWSTWWDDLEAVMVRLGLPLEKVRRSRREYEDLVKTVLPIYQAYPQLPASTGGLELAIRQRIEPLLTGRAHAFGNLERVNRLFDLAVARDHHMFDDLVTVAELLRADATANDGWATALRAVQDIRPPTGTYSSLRDQQLVRGRATQASAPGSAR